jgi:hypothetical protein
MERRPNDELTAMTRVASAIILACVLALACAGTIYTIGLML